MLASDLARLVASFQPDPGDGSSAKSQDLVLMLLENTPLPFSRDQFAPGHITCTGLVLHPDREAFLLIHHKRLDRWLLPGGHVEPEDTEIWHAARREVEEETTAQLASVDSAPLLGIDVHGIPPKRQEPFHLHHDLIFAFRAISPIIKVTDEIRDVIWHDFKDLDSNPYRLPANISLCVYRSFRSLM